MDLDGKRQSRQSPARGGREAQTPAARINSNARKLRLNESGEKLPQPPERADAKLIGDPGARAEQGENGQKEEEKAGEEKQAEPDHEKQTEPERCALERSEPDHFDLAAP
jgi:hypothetical protein